MKTLIPLGTGGFIPRGRHTMCLLVCAEDGALLLDAGTGMARLLDEGIAARLEGVERLEILLTHYHLDHVIGLSYLPGVWAGRPVRIHAPAPPLVDWPAHDALDRLISPPLFPVCLGDLPGPVEVVPYAEGGFRLLGCDIGVRRQSHPGGSVAVRLGDCLVYATDTAPDAETVRFALGVDLLIHEVWVSDCEANGSDPAQSGHSAASAVAAIARAAGVRRLVPIHHHPRRNAGEVAELAESLRSFGGEVVIPVEGEPIALREGTGWRQDSGPARNR
jgi:ribonuclease BN (tRNA processing enzyme)